MQASPGRIDWFSPGRHLVLLVQIELTAVAACAGLAPPVVVLTTDVCPGLVKLPPTPGRVLVPESPIPRLPPIETTVLGATPAITPGSEPMLPELQAGVLAEIAPTVIRSAK